MASEATFVEPSDVGSEAGWEEATVDHRGGSSRRRAAPPSPALRATLSVIEGADRGAAYDLLAVDITVGRGLDNQIVLQDTSVSRQHILIVHGGGDTFRVRDLDSGNGTLVNGDSIDRDLELKDGDELELGETVLRFSLTAVDLPTPPPVSPRPPPPSFSHGQLTSPTKLPLPSPPTSSFERVTDENLLRKTRAQRPRWQMWLLAAGLLALVLTIVAAIISISSHGPTAPAPVVVAVLPQAPADAGAVAATPPPVPSVTPLPRVVEKPATAPAAPHHPAPAHPGAAAAPSAERTALAHYKSSEFDDAAQTLRDAADEDPDQADHLNAMARDYSAVGAALARTPTQDDTSPAAAMVAYEDALGADRRSGREAHGAMLRARLLKVAPQAAAGYLAANRFEEARAACDLAASHGAQADPQVVKVRAQLEDIARDLYNRGHNLEAENAEQAAALFRRVLKIVPPGSTWYGRAFSSLNAGEKKRPR